jgi:hypothetical protein
MPQFRRIVALQGGVPTEEALKRVLKDWPYPWRIVQSRGKTVPTSAHVVVDDLSEAQHGQALDQLNRLLGDADFEVSDYAKEEQSGDHSDTTGREKDKPR